MLPTELHMLPIHQGVSLSLAASQARQVCLELATAIGAVSRAACDHCFGVGHGALERSRVSRENYMVVFHQSMYVTLAGS